MINNDPETLAALSKLGRAATPATPPGPAGLTVASLIRDEDTKREFRTAVLVTQRLRNVLSSVEAVEQLVPGTALTLCADPRIQYLVVEEQALREGMWAGTIDYVSSALVEEVYESAAAVRRNGGLSLWVPSKFPGPASATLVSAMSDSIGEISSDFFEENAPQSALWAALSQYVEDVG